MYKFLQNETGLEVSDSAVAAALVAIPVVAAFPVLGDFSWRPAQPTGISGQLAAAAKSAQG